MTGGPPTPADAPPPRGPVAALFARRPLVRIAVEGFAIVVSILLAFAIDAWWARRTLAQEADVLLAGLEQDFEHFEEVLEHGLESWSVVADAVQLLLETAEGRREATLEELDRAVSWLDYAPTFDERSGTRDSIVGAGRLQLIADAELRALLASSPAQIDVIAENERDYREMHRDHFTPLLIRHRPPDYLYHRGSWGFFAALTGREAPDLPFAADDARPAYYERLLGDLEFRRLLANRYTYLLAILAEYGSALEVSREALRLLARARGPQPAPSR